MKTEQEIKEAIMENDAYMVEDCQILSKAISRKDWSDVISKLNRMQIMACSLFAANEIIN